MHGPSSLSSKLDNASGSILSVLANCPKHVKDQQPMVCSLPLGPCNCFPAPPTARHRNNETILLIHGAHPKIVQLPHICKVVGSSRSLYTGSPVLCELLRCSHRMCVQEHNSFLPASPKPLNPYPTPSQCLQFGVRATCPMLRDVNSGDLLGFP